MSCLISLLPLCVCGPCCLQVTCCPVGYSCGGSQGCQANANLHPLQATVGNAAVNRPITKLLTTPALALTHPTASEQ